MPDSDFETYYIEGRPANELAKRERSSLDWASFKDNIEQAENPNWEQFDSESKPVHDWRAYITDEVREQWAVIDLKARCIVIHIAQSCADQEDWD